MARTRVKKRPKGAPKEAKDQVIESKHHCTILSLPPELRNRIYELVTVEESPITIDWPDIFWSRFDQNPQNLPPKLRHPPALLQTSRQIRNECLPIFYGLNVFHLAPERTNFVAKAPGPFRHLPRMRALEFRTCEHTGSSVRLVMDRRRSQWRAEVEQPHGLWKGVCPRVMKAKAFLETYMEMQPRNTKLTTRMLAELIALFEWH